MARAALALTAALLYGLSASAEPRDLVIECPNGSEYVRIPDDDGRVEKCVTPEGVQLGPQVYRFADGSPALYATFRMPRADEDLLPPIPVGPQLTWWENGTLKDVGVYRGGRQDGPWIHWYRNGSVERIEIYRDGWLVDLHGAAGPFSLGCPPGAELRHSRTTGPLFGSRSPVTPRPEHPSVKFGKWCAKTLADGTESRHGPAVGIGRDGEIVSRWENRTRYSVSQGRWVLMSWSEGKPRRRCQTLTGTGLPCPDDIGSD